MKFLIKTGYLAVLFLLMQTSSVTALTINGPGLSSATFSQKPPVLTARETPLVMLGLSVDNQLFYKAYTDYTDIDSDGRPETTYKDSFEYYGYFQSNWCYSYDVAGESGSFSPSSPANGTNGHYCNGATWSGNFLNWATMTRMDILRRVLYGGKRSTDSEGSTVLERAYIPSDVHAFAKVYKDEPNDGVDELHKLTPFTSGGVDNGTLTLCNVSSEHPYSETSEPELRLAEGDHRRWSINESGQCQWDSGANRPPEEDRLYGGNGLVVRVNACVDGADATESTCKIYSSGQAKPVGLLQQYGEAGDLKFGLISGSYDNYVEGGVLRKNIGLFGSNSDPADDEVDLSTGEFRHLDTDVDGIISNLDGFRIIGWNGSGYNNLYSCNSAGISIADFESGSKPCRDWGNPLSEIYLEAVRYFSEATSATDSFSTDGDDEFISSLSQASWPSSLSVNVHPLNEDTRCASCSIIMISSGVSSFDGDDLASVSDIAGLSGTSDLVSYTDSVGEAEYGNFPQNFLFGDVAPVGSSDLLCSSKSASGLSDVLGICPEAPALQGSYAIAGLANYAKTNDLRTDAGMDGEQVVDTYGVELSETVPSFNIPLEGGEIRFLPSCQSRSGSSGAWIPCSLFDVEILETEVDSAGNLVSGTLVFHWEDSSWGNDYDLDGSQVISFCVGSDETSCDEANKDTRPGADYDDVGVSPGQLRISQAVAYTAAGFNLRFGYVVTGSNKDGAPADSAASGRHTWLVRPGNQNANYLPQLSFDDANGFPRLPLPCGAPSTCTVDSGAQYAYFPEAESFIPSTSSAKLLDRPLLLAAKYGGFTDRDNSGDPSSSDGSNSEWDVTNNRTGEAGPDGIPDNYFFSSNPGLLAGQLQRVFDALVARTASGTNAAVVANNSSGIGAVYQALYQPQLTVGNDTVTWTGTLRAIFIDDFGNLREDSNSNDKLDGFDTDKIVRFEFDPDLDATRIQRYSRNADGTLTADGSPVPLDELKPVWSAVDRLADMNLPGEQRTYGTVDNERRYILSAIDGNGDGEVDQQDVVDFTPSEFAGVDEYFSYLGLPDAASADKIIDYIRGGEQIGFRNRTIDADGDGDKEVWRLGDIIHSTPAVVASPAESYAVAFSDDTYRSFQDQYRNRRQMVYVGANDGMIHAFNGGFWDFTDREFQIEPLTGTAATHPLGQEMWAYAPFNLLPHLRWLAEPDYQHVYYMDGEPLVFDANIFPDDSVHPEGWGTVLVMGMRFGGSPLQVSVGAGFKTMRSAYVVFDVTDPESPPKLLGEITAPELGFTLSQPAVIKNRQPDLSTGDWSAPSVNEWYLVLGSGPRGTAALAESGSDQSPRLFAVDLQQLVENSETAASQPSYFVTLAGELPLTLGTENGFVGGISVTDWDLNNGDDALYVGTAETATASGSGAVYRIRLTNSAGWTGPSGASSGLFSDVNRPVQAAPVTTRDVAGERWVLFGTGRLLVPDDNAISTQEYFFGIKEPRNTDNSFSYDAVDPDTLIDTSDIGVFETSGAVRDLSSGSVAALSISGEDIETFSALQDFMESQSGWKVRMQDSGASPSGRVTGSATLNPSSRGEFAFTEYVPPSQSCEIDGASFLYSLSVLTGTTTPDAPLSTSSDYVVDGDELSLDVVSIGPGYSSEVTFHQALSGGLTAFTNLSTGAITGTSVNVKAPESGRQSWRQIDNLAF